MGLRAGGGHHVPEYLAVIPRVFLVVALAAWGLAMIGLVRQLGDVVRTFRLR